MPIFRQDLDRHPRRRESAASDDQADDHVGNRNTPPAMSLSPDRTEHGRHLHCLDHDHDHDHDHVYRNHARLQSLPRKLSEESIRTELCEGPVLESPVSSTPPPPPPPAQASDRDDGSNSVAYTYTDRAELIERLKKGESPAWLPHLYHLDSTWGEEQSPIPPTNSPAPTATTTSPTLLPPPTITPEKDRALSDEEKRRQDGMRIERPRSALHSGDFTHDEISPDPSSSQRRAHPLTSQESADGGHSWIATSPPRDYAPLNFEKRQSLPVRSDEVRSALSSLSSSISTNFVYKPPTSPLFQSESNDDVDLVSPIDGIDLASSLPRQQRRHTVVSPLPGSYSPSPLQRQTPLLRQEKTFPYQAHQPRRSLTTTSSLSIAPSSPQTPAFLQSRRPSISSDASPLQHASMVGSYEESILRGRMSTTPSRPLDFLAQIGVLGLGKCKSNLRCPPHVTLPFPAVFYSYGTPSHGRSKENDGPSPYVGQIDLENGLPNQGGEARSKRKHQSRAVERAAEADVMDSNYTEATPSSRDARKAQRAKRRSGSPRGPPGGSYRIPEKGRIQVIIKNPNKTAVKLFLVPYDLAGMEPGTKTFVRQRCYSNGPIIDNMPDLKGNPSADRPILRYLIHLHICCPSRGRFYLYKNIRVVFANRVPDGKEKLQNEITLPEPRFTPYKATRVMHPPLSSGTGPGANLAADAAFRRRSSGFYFGAASRAFDAAEGFASPSPSHPLVYSFAGDHTPVEPVPFRVPANQTRRPMEDVNSILETYNPQSSVSSQISRPTTDDSNGGSNWDGYDGQIDQYNKLNRGDVGYGGNAFAGLINGNPVVAESLLSQRLRSLGVQKPASGEKDELPKPLEE
ncbi:hypothetical protein O1611_g4185 [Lasiodiplodia mahajangana]|uniref:Uncharacterized protein n=1 Tax=Lasiodiplodia mahajangana TaxID=1108764 RepID=A0ACC2JQA9_9PEZI|nr:hypothetical protein O1611_g4185 [Lasiodiplodia mahajangana]